MKDEDVTYSKLAEITGIARTSITRNASMFFKMLGIKGRRK